MGLLFKVSGLYKIPQRPAFSLFSSINNLLLLCFSLQTKEKPILHIKIESSIAERAVMAQSILSSSGRGSHEVQAASQPASPSCLETFCLAEMGSAASISACLTAPAQGALFFLMGCLISP